MPKIDDDPGPLDLPAKPRPTKESSRCIACEGTGCNSRGDVCPICAGDGWFTPTEIADRPVIKKDADGVARQGLKPGRIMRKPQ